MRADARPRAVLLVGPTGAGKTPLGEALARHGLEGQPCAHFDFGARLRAVASGAWCPAGLTPADVAAIANALRDGALLTDAQFPIAAALLAAFLAEHGAPSSPWIVLNGMPRHLGQARDVGTFVDVRCVVHLDTSTEVVRARILADAGGDRVGRDDDGAARVARRIARFQRDTLPLVAHYAGRGAHVVTVPVGPTTRAEALRRTLRLVP